MTAGGQPRHRTLFESLEHHGRGRDTTIDPATFTLAMLPLIPLADAITPWR